MGYSYNLCVLLIFNESYLPHGWNANFTFLFNCFSERAIGSNDMSKLFHTLLYGLFSVDKNGFGYILWTQFVQILVSKSMDTKIYCAWFWLIMVKQALNHHKIPTMVDAMMADIQKMSTSMFVTSYSKNFHYVGSVLEVMLARVPMDSDII